MELKLLEANGKIGEAFTASAEVFEQIGRASCRERV
jgi:hypothetical protein